MPELRRPRTSQAARPLPGDVRLMRRAGTALFALAGLLLLVAGLGLLVQQPAFALQRLVVEEPLERSSGEVLRRQALPRLKGNFFTLDLEDAQAAFEAVPWVRRAVVRRLWPNRLAVSLEEHQPAALWRGDDGVEGLVNQQGEVFEANAGDVDEQALPTLVGPVRHAAAMLAMWRSLNPLFAPMHTELRSLALTARGSWRGELGEGAVVEFGRGSPEELAQRTQAFVTTAQELIRKHDRPLAHADLRHAAGYALRLRGLGTLAPGEKPTN